LILVDTSVWIDFFSPSPGRAGSELRWMIEEAEPFALTGVIVTEILQGLRRDVHRIERFLSLWEMLEPRGFSTYREASATLFSLDKDFSRIARMTPLRLHSLLEPAP
jgi:predicted nucleic acid-binding protein